MSDAAKPDSALPKELLTETHDGHRLRTRSRSIVDRSKLSVSTDAASPPPLSGGVKKAPNLYSGHTFLNRPERFRLDGHKMIYHMDRVQEWRRGERIAPIHIDMGLTKFCNIACIYCIGVTQGGMKKGQMIQPDALLRLIRDAGRLQVRSVAFIGDGEPTLNPALYDAIVLARECGVETAMATNGILLDMNRAHDVLRNQTFVRFNLSAGNSEGFRRIHQAAPALFDELIQKIRELVRLRKENQYGCTLGLQMVLIPENFDQVLTLARLGADLGVDYLQVKQCSDTEYGELGIQREEYRRVVDTLKEAESLSREDYSVQVKWNKINILAETDVYRHGIRKYDICYGTPMLGQISGNGKVYPCGPFFGKDRFLIGDIHRMSYYDMIKGDRYWAVQRDIVENIDVHCDCTIGCRQDYINTFLWDLMNPPAHVNFI